MGETPRTLSVENLESRLNLSITLPTQPALGLPLNAMPRNLGAEYGTAAAATPTVMSLTDEVPAAPLQRYRIGALDGGSAIAATTGASAAQVYFDASHQQSSAALPTTSTAAVTFTPATVPPADTTGNTAVALAPHQLQGPIQALTWNAPPTDAANLTGMIRVDLSSDPVAIARLTQAAPPGQAGLLIWWDMAGELFNTPADQTINASGASTGQLSPWLSNGIAIVKQRMETFFQQFYAAGGRADSVVMDDECGLNYYSISTSDVQAIFQDPRFAAFQTQYNIPSLSAVLGGNINAFNAALTDASNKALNAAVFDVISRYFPNAATSNYNSYAMTTPNAAPDSGGNWLTYNSSAGNESAPAMYGDIHIQFMGNTPYGNTAFDAVRWETNAFRGILNSSNNNVTPWLAYKSFSGALQNSPYYDEAIYQLALSGSSEFLLWNPQPWVAGQDPTQFSNAAEDQALNNVLQTLNDKFGNAVRTPVTTSQMDWNSGLVVSGMQIGTSEVLWRITVPPGVQQVQVVQTGQVLDLNGGAGVWYESTPGATVTFAPM